MKVLAIAGEPISAECLRAALGAWIDQRGDHVVAGLEQRGCRQRNGENRTVDRVSLMTTERVADLIGDHAWREMSLRLVDALKADTLDLAERPGYRREGGRITARRRTRETHTRHERGSRAGPLPGSGRRLEAPVA